MQSGTNAQSCQRLLHKMDPHIMTFDIADKLHNLRQPLPGSTNQLVIISSTHDSLRALCQWRLAAVTSTYNNATAHSRASPHTSRHITT